MMRGMVLGAGGVLGFAWSVGALHALRETMDFDPRDADVLVGTSAGSVTAALLGLGVSVDALVRHQQGIPMPADPALNFDYDNGTGGYLPPRPSLRLGSPRLLAHSIRHPRDVNATTALSAVLPRGRGSLAPIGRLVADLRGDEEWTGHRATWIAAMDFATGHRVVFGRDHRALLDQAVMASCAIPGWYAPVEIDGRCYVDGGPVSVTSVDLLEPLGLDEVYVIAPMASLDPDHPDSMAARLERRYRAAVTRRVLREVEGIQATGARVIMLAPTAADLAVIGANLMDHRRRADVLETSLRTNAQFLRQAAA
jgi:NTE family protein